ncbi:hypothetical protein ACQKOE_07710 [Novosphingobium sp. NPDC080210]|uniref:hypothetical protein n=1 Tax=Novosphingobium sp. NPDC080210 TaxID=3390596 RepID=UPI003CFF22DD
MAKNLNVGDVIDKNKLSSSAVWVALLEIQIVNPNDRTVVETIYVVNNTEDILFEGNVYQKANFDFKIEQRNGEAPSVTLTANDQTQIIHKKLEDYAGGVFSNVTMKVVNAESLDRPAEMIEKFQVTSSSIRGYVVTLQLGAENPLTINFPKHTQRQDQCAWRYKGFGCGYAGALSQCDYTKDGPNGCRAHNNLANFRALPGLVRMNI